MQYGRPFDHKSTAGQVWGDNRFAFEQGGQLYDAHKRPVDASGKLMPLDPKTAKRAAPMPPPVAEDEPDEDASGVLPAAPAADATDDGDDEEQIDLVAWAKGHTPSIPWVTVKKAIFSQLNVHVTKKPEAAELILAKLGAAAQP